MGAGVGEGSGMMNERSIEMAKNIQKCLRCKKDLLAGFRLVLMDGPLGYRRYAVCLTCAKKLGAGAPAQGGRQDAVKRERAGA